jgi:hypothetical protein
MTPRGLGARLDNIEALLRHLVAKTAPVQAAAPEPIIWRHGRRPDFWRDQEVRALLLSLWRTTTLDDARRQAVAQFGDSRAPSRAAIGRLWKAMDRAKFPARRGIA